jgi:tetratricopeptide (TPR) repeat protein
MMSTPTSKRYRDALPTGAGYVVRVTLYWAKVTVLYLAALAGLAVAIGPTGPSIAQLLDAAATARAAYRYDRALAFYTEASHVDASNPRPYCLSGEVYMLQREYAEAVTAYHQCAARDSANPDAWLGLGDALQASGNASGARVAWQRSMDAGGQTAIHRLALDAERAQRFSQADALWARLPRDDHEALMHRGLIALWSGDYALANADFQLLRAQPNRWARQVSDDGFVTIAAHPLPGYKWQSLLGYTFLAAGMPEFALQPLRTAVSAAPRFGDAHAYLGWTLWLLGQHAEARHEIATGLRLSPKLSFAHFAAGQMAASGRQATRAITLFQQGLTLDGRNPALWESLGQEEAVANHFIEATFALRMAAVFSHDPQYTVAYLQLFLTYHYGLGNGSAQAAIVFALQDAPRSEPVLFLVGQLYDLLGNTSFALSIYQQAQALDPGDSGPYVMLGNIEENAGNYVVAALDLRTALALRPHGPFAERARSLLAPIASIQV